MRTIRRRLMAISITRRFEFCAGHRVYGHEGKCAHVHGHQYFVEITVTTPRLDALGMVIDFSAIKEVIGTWIDLNWDHGMLLNVDDPLVDFWATELRGHKYFALPYNPTAENIARYLLQKVCPEEMPDLTTTKVKVWETPNCYAEARLDD
jgi:6-pyruvoyltetrahydropterin/6-carboxytetrahydropterin synthase